MSCFVFLRGIFSLVLLIKCNYRKTYCHKFEILLYLHFPKKKKKSILKGRKYCLIKPTKYTKIDRSFCGKIIMGKKWILI